MRQRTDSIPFYGLYAVDGVHSIASGIDCISETSRTNWSPVTACSTVPQQEWITGWEFRQPWPWNLERESRTNPNRRNVAIGLRRADCYLPVQWSSRLDVLLPLSFYFLYCWHEKGKPNQRFYAEKPIDSRRIWTSNLQFEKARWWPNDFYR